MDGRSGSSVVTETVTVDDRDSSRPEIRQDVPVLTLRVAKTKTGKKVNWTEGTVDNEHLNRRKSKCCCIYEKPRAFGESSSDSDGSECENCFGHVEKKKKNRNKKQNNPDGSGTDPQSSDPSRDNPPVENTG